MFKFDLPLFDYYVSFCRAKRFKRQRRIRSFLNKTMILFYDVIEMRCFVCLIIVCRLASIQKRRERSWLLTVETGYTGQGKRLKKTKTIRIDNEKLLKTTRRLQDYLDTELAKFKLEIEAREYITSGHMRLDEIKPLHILTIIDKSSKPGARIDGHGDTLLSGSAEYIFRVLKNIFSHALAWQLIKRHPMDGIKKPKVTQPDIQYYDETEAQHAIDALYTEPDMWKLFFIGALLGGFRRGELIALEFTEVDFQTNSIYVNKSISLTQNGEAAIKRPKSKSSIRSVTMPEWYMAELKEYHDKWIDLKLKVDNLWAGGEHQYVFHIGFGKPLYHSTPSHWWKRFTVRHNLKPVSLHSLRHSTASFLLENNISMKAVQVRLGHARYQTTADLYTHITKSTSRAAADKFEKLNPKHNAVNNPSTSAISNNCIT